MKRLIVVFTIGILSIWVIIPAHAAQLISGDTVALSSEVSEDAYIGGGTIFIKSDINHDAVIGGGQITIDGSIGEDLLAAGGTINVNGAINDDTRIAGGDIRITNTVGGDLAVAGGSVSLNSNTVVDGDTFIVGGVIFLDGIVKGKTRIVGGDVIINGSLEGEVDIRADSIIINGLINGPSIIVGTHEIKIESDAQFNADIRYWSQGGEIDFGSALKSGTALFDTNLKFSAIGKEGTKLLFGFFGIWFAYTVLSAALIILLLMLVAHPLLLKASSSLQSKFWKQAGLGVLYFILMPITAIVLFVSVVGWPLALFVTFAYAFSLLFAKVLTAYILALWLQKKFSFTWNKFTTYLGVLLVYIVLKFLVFIPIIGWFALVVLISAAFGSLMLTKYNLYKKIMR